MSTVLATSISGIAHIRAFDETFRDKAGELDVAAVLVHLTEQVPADALDTLIAQWGVTGDGISVASATEDVKRELLRQAALLNARRGTIYVLRYMFTVAGMPDIDVVEASGLNITRYYDGTWYYSGVIPYGFQWHWAQYAVTIYVDTATVTVSEAVLGAMDFVLKAYAPARCEHIGYTLRNTEADALAITDNLTITVL